MISNLSHKVTLVLVDTVMIKKYMLGKDKMESSIIRLPAHQSASLQVYLERKLWQTYLIKSEFSV